VEEVAQVSNSQSAPATAISNDMKSPKQKLTAGKLKRWRVSILTCRPLRRPWSTTNLILGRADDVTPTHYDFRVDMWTPDGSDIIEHIAGVDHWMLCAVYLTLRESVGQLR